MAPKILPNGSMMVFIPMMDLYNSSTAFHAKLQFNPKKYIGDKTLFCIGGYRILIQLCTLKMVNLSPSETS